jgi:hypothetical protein
MAKYFSFVAEDVTPLSQNSRNRALITKLGTELINANNLKPGNVTLPMTAPLTKDLEAKVFYIHNTADNKDADNISKPLWDSLNKIAYDDDKQIKYLETLKINQDDTSDISELDLTYIDSEDFTKIVDFIFDPTRKVKRILYICVSDYESKKVRF